MKLSYALLFFVAGVPSLASAAFTVTSFDRNQWGASDSTLGVNGYTIEDFEDVNLVNGFQVSVASANGNLAQTSTLPNTFKPSDDLFGNAFTLGGGGAWDGQHGILNTRTNQTFNYGESGSWGVVTFHFTAGATSIGFSIQQMDRDAYLVVNGNSIGTVFGLAPDFNGSNGRQGYLRLDASGSDVIQSVALMDAFGGGDGYMFDHVAFNAVPEPASLTALGLGALALMRRRSRSRA
jgi:hypothetical protein